MALYFINSEKTPVALQKIDASVLSYPSLPTSQLFSFEAKNLRLLIKEMVTELFTIRYSHIQLERNQSIEAVSDKRGLHSRVMLQNELHFSVEEIGNFHLEQDAVSMVLSDSVRCKALFEGGKVYKTLDIYLAPGMVEQLSAVFPLLHTVQPSRSLLPERCVLSPAAKEIVDEILDCPYDADTSRFYFDLKVREYFYVLLQQHGYPPKSRYRFTPYETEQVYRAREILLHALEKPPLTIRQLSREVGIHEDKLKAGFKHFFHEGVFECLLRARMQKAKELLLHTDMPMKQICSLAGYPRITNFITAFRKYYGFTPASLRRSS